MTLSSYFAFSDPRSQQDELTKRGALFHTGLVPMASHVEVHRELVTGQNPNSSSAFAEAFVKKLNETTVKPRQASLVAVAPPQEIVAEVA